MDPIKYGCCVVFLLCHLNKKKRENKFLFEIIVIIFVAYIKKVMGIPKERKVYFDIIFGISSIHSHVSSIFMEFKQSEINLTAIHTCL